MGEHLRTCLGGHGLRVVMVPRALFIILFTNHLKIELKIYQGKGESEMSETEMRKPKKKVLNLCGF